MNKKGFTLVELLIVIAIIGILATLGSFSYINSMKKARDGRRKTDLEMIRGALELYKSDEDSYPGNLDLLVSGNYIKNIPQDPKENTVYTYIRNASNDYCLGAVLEINGDGSCVELSCDDGSNNFCVENP